MFPGRVSSVDADPRAAHDLCNLILSTKSQQHELLTHIVRPPWVRKLTCTPPAASGAASYVASVIRLGGRVAQRSLDVCVGHDGNRARAERSE